MKKLTIYGILVGLITMGGTLFYAIDMMGDDMINIITIAIASLIMILSIGSTLQYVHQIKYKKSEGELAPASWDDIRKYTNDIPKIWGYSFLASIVFVLWYILIAYPLNSFSQIGQYNEEVLEYNAKYEKKWENIKDDKQALNKMGKSLFLNKCAACHGILADGLNGASRDLVYWMSEKHVEDVIVNGSKGSFAVEMPAGMAVGEDAKAISAYVVSEFFGKEEIKNAHLISQGKELYVSCAGCHGMDGNGVEGLAPSLRALTTSALNTGRKGDIGVMPMFNDLNAIQKDALNNYIQSLN